MSRFTSLLALLLVFAGFCIPLRAQSQRWPEAKANAWYQQQPWLVGSNFTPADAINQLEMCRPPLSIRRRLIKNWAGPRGWA